MNSKKLLIAGGKQQWQVARTLSLL